MYEVSQMAYVSIFLMWHKSSNVVHPLSHSHSPGCLVPATAIWHQVATDMESWMQSIGSLKRCTSFNISVVHILINSLCLILLLNRTCHTGNKATGKSCVTSPAIATNCLIWEMTWLLSFSRLFGPEYTVSF
jgi:hypothetical protein